MARTPVRFDYIKDPKDIYRQSFAMIDAALNAHDLEPAFVPIAARLIHACGMPDILEDLLSSPGAAETGKTALADGAPVLCDSEMVASGITRRLLPAENRVICTLNDARVPELAARHQTTRSAAALDLWTPHLEGAVVAIGNAPTVLFRLLEMISDGGPRPALILGFAVGYIGAAESKKALVDHADNLDLSYITLSGRRGGSALASAAVNALAAGTGS